MLYAENKTSYPNKIFMSAERIRLIKLRLGCGQNVS